MTPRRYSHNCKETSTRTSFTSWAAVSSRSATRSELQANYGRQQAFNYPDSSDRHQATYATYTDVYNSSWTNNLLINEALTPGRGSIGAEKCCWINPRQAMTGSVGGALDYADSDISRNNTGFYALGQYQQHGITTELSGRTDDNQQYGRHNTWQIGAGLEFLPRLSFKRQLWHRLPCADLY